MALKRMLMVIMNGDGHGSDDEDHEDGKGRTRRIENGGGLSPGAAAD